MGVLIRSRKARTFSILTALCLCFVAPRGIAASSGSGLASNSALDHGFAALYNLDFAGAQKDFAAWQKQHPDDPMGPVSEAAGSLFSEFNRLGILESQFYADVASFEARSRQKPDPAIRERFNDALGRADRLARTRLAGNPKDRDALFA